jgi:hypothetical protein
MGAGFQDELMKLPILYLLVALLAAGCSSSSDAPRPPATLQSPGGNWAGTDSMGRRVNLVIDETGKLRAFIQFFGNTEPPVFFAGSVSVSGTEQLAGAMRGQSVFGLAFFPLPVDDIPAVIAPVVYSCSISGTVRERTRLSAQITCSDDASIRFDESVNLLLDPNYLTGSSLEAIAGNYTMEFKPSTNMLNIAADGTVFGMYDGGPTCTVNGRVSEIDTRFSLLDVEWTMSACTDLFGFYEGAVFDGFSTRTPNPTRPNSYYFMLTWERPEGLSVISVNYDPT